MGLASHLASPGELQNLFMDTQERAQCAGACLEPTHVISLTGAHHLGPRPETIRRPPPASAKRHGGRNRAIQLSPKRARTSKENRAEHARRAALCPPPLRYPEDPMRCIAIHDVPLIRQLRRWWLLTD